MHADLLGRPLRNLRLSVTDRCNLRCEYCMPEDEYNWLPREDVLHFEEISALVDICNWCSLEFQLPYGLYDLSAIEPPIDLRLGVHGEEYEGIRKDVVHVAGRILLADALGPFGNPTSDSARSMVTPSTVRALCTVFAPGELPAARIDGILTTTARRFHDFTGAGETWRGVI